MSKNSIASTVAFLKKQNDKNHVKYDSDGFRITNGGKSAIHESEDGKKKMEAHIGVNKPMPQRASRKSRLPRRAMVERNVTIEMTNEQILKQQASLKLLQDFFNKQVAGSTVPHGINKKEVIKSVSVKLLFSEITQGEALSSLRLLVLNLNQDKFAKLVGISRKKLSEIENDKGNPSIDVLNKAFRPFGLSVGITPISPDFLQRVTNENF